MKKHISGLKKIVGITLTAVVISMLAPVPVRAEEVVENEIQTTEGFSDISISDISESDAAEVIKGAEPDSLEAGGNEAGRPASNGQSGDEKMNDETGDEKEPAVLPPMAIAVPMDSSDTMYEDLSQFLALIADRFQVYTIAIVDPATQQPVVPDEPVEVSVQIPAHYDMSRTVVAEISQEAGVQTPVWLEITFEDMAGQAVFETDHPGIFVIAEEKSWNQLPEKLEMTSEVEKLELSKAHPTGTLPMSHEFSTVVPKTGDDHSVFIWGAVTVLAAAAVIAGIIIIIKRRK